MTPVLSCKQNRVISSISQVPLQLCRKVRKDICSLRFRIRKALGETRVSFWKVSAEQNPQGATADIVLEITKSVEVKDQHIILAPRAFKRI